MADFDYATAAPLIADLQAAQATLNTAVETGDEAFMGSSVPLSGTGRPTTQAAAKMAAAVTALADYIETLAPQ